MTTMREIENICHISHADVDDLAAVLIRSISGMKNNSQESHDHQNRTIGALISFLEKYLSEEFPHNEDKLVVVKFLDKIQLQKELIEMKLKGLSIEDLKVAAERLGKKSQSAFGNN